MKRLFFFTLIVFSFLPSFSGVAFVSPLQSPILCTTIKNDCYKWHREANAINPKELQMEEWKIEADCEAKFNDCLGIEDAEPLQKENEIPVFILERRWPLPSINPGNNECTYFTDGTKFCR